MENREEIRNDVAADADNARTAAPEVAPEVSTTAPKKPRKQRTFGNVIYDFGVFGSIAWVGVAALSAFSAHEAMHGNNKFFGWLRKLNDYVFNGLSNQLSKIFKNANKETIDGYAKGTTMFVTLGMGGNALMLPIKWMEDNRQRNAARIDNLLGTMPPDAETIEHEPKQTWKSVFSGRMMSWGLSYAAFLAMGPKFTSKISNWFGEHSADIFMRLRPQSNAQNVRKWADIAAFDALFTIITASLTYAFSRTIAKKDEEPKPLGEGLFELSPAAPTFFHDVYDANAATVPENTKNFTQSVKAENRSKPKAHGSHVKRVESEPELSHAL